MANRTDSEAAHSQLTAPLSAAAALLLGFRLICRPGLRLFALAPFAINTVVLATVAAYAGSRFHAWVDAWVPALPDWLHWLQYAAWVLFAVGVVLIASYVFTLLANLIAGPFNDLLSERVEAHLRGTRPESGHGFWRSLQTGFVFELRQLWFLLKRTLLLGLASVALIWIPGLNALIPLLWMYFGAYMLAFEYLDIPMSSHGLSFEEKRRWLRRHHVAGMSFGGCITLANLVPGMNLLIMPAAVAGATVLWVSRNPVVEAGRDSAC